MRDQMYQTVTDILFNDKRTSLLLADIGVWGFRKALSSLTNRVFNIGIMESSIVSAGAGMALGGMIPIIYGIAPFFVDRALEQIKLDFCYQQLGGNILLTGASYDFSTSGPTHYCPECIGVLKNIPGLQIITPGSAAEFSHLFKETYSNEYLTIFRLVDWCNSNEVQVELGKANIMKTGTKAVVIVIAELLDSVLQACKDEDVTILYYATLAPFDIETLRSFSYIDKVFICEPFYKGALLNDIFSAYNGKKISIYSIGLPKIFIDYYGTKCEKDIYFEFNSESIHDNLIKFIKL